MTIPSGRSGARGDNAIGERAIDRIIDAAIESVPGTVLAGSTINRMAGRGYPRVDVRVDARTASVAVETDIAVSWPSPVRDVARAVRATVAAWVPAMTGLSVSRVDVRVARVVGADGDQPWPRVDGRAIAARDVTPELSAPVARPLPARRVAAPTPPEIRPVTRPGSTRGPGARGSRALR
ncbi:Asp23/Gls24 family envelope stress response protein [uncultured Corynebacterium sp.]|uniref:Asp23/Gls24 family envelope stress response protein n=1 Tax=uncultured Corynebacterium sp. TaxID=159447 RepID=UPI0025D59B8B|nr:Asp23/Gls24 family envelope stress response protein [uncultured Corynebacterium sp.]